MNGPGLILPPGVTPPHVDRMATELSELKDRIEKLTGFMMTPGTAYDGLEHEDKVLLNAQHGAMLAYQGILLCRFNKAIQPS